MSVAPRPGLLPLEDGAQSYVVRTVLLLGIIIFIINAKMFPFDHTLLL